MMVIAKESDPLQYPLLFPQGERGYHQGIKKRKTGGVLGPCLGQGRVIHRHSATAKE